MVKRKLIFALMACILLGVLPLYAFAVTPVEVDRSCSLTVSYAHNGQGFANVTVVGYRVAEVAPDGTFTLTGSFADYPVNIYGITSQTEWKEVSRTLASYAAADKLEPDLQAGTDATGTAFFGELKTGMYLICAVDTVKGDTVYQFEEFIVYLPRPQEDGTHAYDVSARPKYTSYTLKPQEVEFQVVKLWKDGGKEDRRPSSVTVQILRNGELYTTQTLSGENNWTYRWKAPDDGSRWQIAERDVPKGYRVAVGGDGRSFVVTNTYDGGQEDPPQTGDTAVLWPWVLAMCLSGGGLMVMGIYGMRKRK